MAGRTRCPACIRRVHTAECLQFLDFLDEQSLLALKATDTVH